MGLRERVLNRYLAESLPERVAGRFADMPNRRPPKPFQPRIKHRDWADISEPDGLGDFVDITEKEAWTGLPGDIGAIASRTAEEEERSDYGQMSDYLDKEAKKFKKGHAWWVPPHNMAINAALMEMNFWYFTIKPVKFTTKWFREATDRYPAGFVIDPGWAPFKDGGWDHTLKAAEAAVKLAKQMRTITEAIKKDIDEMEAETGQKFPEASASKIINEAQKVAERRWHIDRLRVKKILVPIDGSKPMELSSWGF